jgi:drug/metabolite transporter (DMT)-like permease
MPRMPTEVMLLVLLGAALHASWNVLIKSSADAFLNTALIATAGAAIALAALPFLPAPDRRCWPWLLGSAAIHVVYFTLVVAAYRHAEVSLAYPLMRGSAPLLVALLSGALLGESLPPAGWAGVLLICGGVLALGLSGARRAGGRGVAFALANAVVIAAYTLVDGTGTRVSGAPATYVLWLFVLNAPPLLGWALWRRPGALLALARARWPLALLGAGCTVGSYGLALWAMTRAPIAAVAALRETAILFGLLFAAVLLKERVGWGRAGAGAAIAAGAMLLRAG